LAASGETRRAPLNQLELVVVYGNPLAGAEVHQGVMAAGLDPSLGFLHQAAPGRESMVLDFTEVFRCAVDHFVLAWIAPQGPQRADYFSAYSTRMKFTWDPKKASTNLRKHGVSL
jgi:CRISPR-associated protein Cas1